MPSPCGCSILPDDNGDSSVSLSPCSAVRLAGATGTWASLDMGARNVAASNANSPLLSVKKSRVCIRVETGPDVSQQIFQILGVHRLDHVVVEPRLASPGAVLLLAVAGQGHQRQPVSLRLLPEPLCHLVAVHPRHADIQEHKV